MATFYLEANSSGRRGSNKPSAVAIDHTCSFVAVGDCSGGVRVWDVSQTSGALLSKTAQDSSGRLPSSISFLSWFKAHARRVSFIAFTSNSDIVTVSSGACVRVWSVMGAAIGKVGKAFHCAAGGGLQGARFHIDGKEEPEVSSRGLADDENVGDDAEGGGEGRAGRGCNVEGDQDDQDDDGDDEEEEDETGSAAAFGQLATQVMTLQRQRLKKLAHRRVT